jgi:hypothetical protein
MAMMKHDITIEQLIEEAYRKQPWLGVSSLEEAIEATKAYRRNLNDSDRQLFDEQLRLGRYPAAVIETVEIAAGRDRPQSSSVYREEPVEAKSA